MEQQCRRRQRARRLSGTWVAAAVTLLVSHVFMSLPPAAGAPSECLDDAVSDVDGGGPDVIVGHPSYDLPGMPDAGALLIFSNVVDDGRAEPSPPTAVTLLTANDFLGLRPQPGARFGASVVVWRDTAFDDDDHCADILVGAPGQNVDGIPGAGEVYLIRGTSSGPEDVTTIFNEAKLFGAGAGQPGAGFGSALAADTLQTIAIGVPQRDVGNAVDAGRVVRLDYSNAPDPKIRIIEQGGTGGDLAEPGDQFGEVLELMPTAARPILFVGIPHEDVGAQGDAGAVALALRQGQLSLVTQDSPGAGGVAESGDRYGAALAAFTHHPVGMIAIGVPGEDLSGEVDAGMVSYAGFRLPSGPDQDISPVSGLTRTLTQASAEPSEPVEAGDQFGASLLAGEFGQKGQLDLVVGAPLEDVGSAREAGLVIQTPIHRDGSVDPESRATSWLPDPSGEPARPEPGDQFGSALSSVELGAPDGDEPANPAVIITVPGRDQGRLADAGMVYLRALSSAGSVPLTASIRQAEAGPRLAPMKVG